MAASTLGIILAAGTSRRFGSDKAFATLAGKPLVEHVALRARPQVGTLLVNANESHPRLAQLGLEMLPDAKKGEGPNAGILAALALAADRGFARVASFPCDSPFFPPDLVAKLGAALDDSGADFAVARRGQDTHRVFAVWPVTSFPALAERFKHGARSMMEVTHGLKSAFAEFPPQGDGPNGDPFFNINTPDDLATAETWLANRGAEQ